MFRRLRNFGVINMVNLNHPLEFSDLLLLLPRATLLPPILNQPTDKSHDVLLLRFALSFFFDPINSLSHGELVLNVINVIVINTGPLHHVDRW